VRYDTVVMEKPSRSSRALYEWFLVAWQVTHHTY
jgi:hypothetical protein